MRINQCAYSKSRLEPLRFWRLLTIISLYRCSPTTPSLENFSHSIIGKSNLCMTGIKCLRTLKIVSTICLGQQKDICFQRSRQCIAYGDKPIFVHLLTANKFIILAYATLARPSDRKIRIQKPHIVINPRKLSKIKSAPLFYSNNQK